MKFTKLMQKGALALLFVSALMVSCQGPEAVEDVLSVEPSSSLFFAATDNEDVVFSVTTNVAEWTVDAPDWITKEQKGNTLIVNVIDNSDPDVQRVGKITFSAGNAEDVSINVIQDVAEPGQPTLSVSPMEKVQFKDRNNTSVVLRVETNQPSWDYTVPDWIQATKEEGKLIVNANDNDGGERSGFIKVRAGEAKDVTIIVIQAANSEPLPEGVTATLKDQATKTSEVELKATIQAVLDLHLVLSLNKASEGESTVTVSVAEESYLNEFNLANDRNCLMLPSAAYTLPSSMSLSVADGMQESESSITVSVNGKDESMEYHKEYLLPLVITENSDNINVTPRSKRVNYIIVKQNNKAIKNLVCFEVNDVNPLNALEVKLDDGSYFFDAVVLFSGNIAWDNGTQSVRFNARTGEPVCNRNIQVLVDEWEKYIKPLRDAGLKVYMGILPHHTPAGTTTLSKEGCKMFGQEIANIIDRCHLNGVFLDEEYVENKGDYGYMTDLWSKPAAGGSYFAYQMKKQMDLKVKGKWDTGVIIYQLGAHYGDTVTDHEDGTVHKPNEFIEMTCGDYGKSGTPYVGMTKADCSAMSIELGKQTGWTGSSWVRDGYGWCMYFNYNPAPNNSGIRKWSIERFQEVAGYYYDGLKVIEPTHYYKKTANGFDPNRYEL